MNSYIPYNFMFLLLTMLGTIFSISSSHWIGVWAGLEINLLGFIPMLVYGGTTLEVESGVKYFIIQSMGSGILLTGSLLISITALSWANFGSLLSTNYLSSHLYQSETNLYGILVLISLLIKVGLTPFHFWLPSVMSGLSWLSVLLLASWQKIAPLILILMVVSKYSSMLMACCAAASVVGGIGGLNQTQLRSLMAYSSINHLGWMVAGSIYNVASMVIYFAIYFLISVFLFYYLWIKEKSQTRQLSTSSFRSTNEKLVFSTLILSLGGLPPLLGFVGKWLILTELFNIEPLILMFLILGSLISLFYYLLLFFSYFFSNNSKITEMSMKNYTSMTVSMYFIVASISMNFSGPIMILWLPSLIL
uniref:NADH-ubiquinone oxidoreductase chain 2 n=1 Tax=Solemya elarraichensis TaxID=1345011 RepID=A0A1W5WVB5_9BIVA|nr:NADH dehydrogenase subunit 2 [Solemya elarraichensis]ARH10758.1 NADH dehydrogenase subunit 2 [Solemya elarraichensis]